jgi:hypothetical protein
MKFETVGQIIWFLMMIALVSTLLVIMLNVYCAIAPMLLASFVLTVIFVIHTLLSGNKND